MPEENPSDITHLPDRSRARVYGRAYSQREDRPLCRPGISAAARRILSRQHASARRAGATS